MTVKFDLSDKKFGRLLVLNLDIEINIMNTKWLCKCDCGQLCHDVLCAAAW